jgi:homoserine kinase type II
LGAAMRFLITRMTDWLNPKKGALVNLKNPMEYFQKLCFHATAKDFHSYGI